MVVVKPHIRLSWGGTIGTPAAEVWTNSLSFTGVTDQDSEVYQRQDLVDRVEQIKTILTAFITGANSLTDTSVSMTWIKLNKIGANGKYVDNPNTALFAPVKSAHVFAGTIWQQSTVISLLTGKDRGRGSRGRIYPPVTGMPVGADGYLTAAAATAMQTGAVTLIGDLNKIEGPTSVLLALNHARWNVCVVSNEANGQAPLLTPVTRLYVDRVPDVQRRRVNRLPVLGVAPTTTYVNV